MIIKVKYGWKVVSKKGKNLGGPYTTRGEAVKRLQQVEYFKHSEKIAVSLVKLAKISQFQILKKYKVPLTPEERSECMRRKAVWHFHFGRDGKKQATPAVWKSINKTGQITYVTNTHRAYNIAPTLKGAINRFHVFIKGTAA